VRIKNKALKKINPEESAIVQTMSYLNNLFSLKNKSLKELYLMNKMKTYKLKYILAELMRPQVGIQL